MPEYKYTVIVEQNENGVYIASVPALCSHKGFKTVVARIPCH